MTKSMYLDLEGYLLAMHFMSFAQLICMTCYIIIAWQSGH